MFIFFPPMFILPGLQPGKIYVQFSSGMNTICDIMMIYYDDISDMREKRDYKELTDFDMMCMQIVFLTELWLSASFQSGETRIKKRQMFIEHNKMIKRMKKVFGV